MNWMIDMGFKPFDFNVIAKDHRFFESYVFNF